MRENGESDGVFFLIPVMVALLAAVTLDEPPVVRLATRGSPTIVGVPIIRVRRMPDSPSS